MPASLSLAEFKVRLSDRAGREALGLTITDQEALRVLVDDQRIADLYVHWRTTNESPVPVPQGPGEAPKPAPVGFWRRPLTWVVGGAVVVGLIVGGVVLTNTLVENSRKQQFAQILTEDPTVSDNLRNLEGSSLDASFNVNCDKVRDGWGEQDQLIASTNGWKAAELVSEVSEEQYFANGLAMFRAAVEVCG